MNPFKLYIRYVRWNARVSINAWRKHPVKMIIANVVAGAATYIALNHMEKKALES